MKKRKLHGISTIIFKEFIMFFKSQISGMVVLIYFIFSTSCSLPDIKKPNILFIMMDDLGYGQFGLYNDTLKTSDFDPFFTYLVDSLQGYSHEKALEFSKSATPVLSELARNGVIFTKAYTSSSLCAPSRLGIATGILQNNFGVYTNEDCETTGLPKGSHLTEKLNAMGYKTGHIGKWHIGKRDEQMITRALQRKGINDTLSYGAIMQRYPMIYKELEEGGFVGSVVESQNPLNNGFDYYYGYNNWASQFYNSTLVWENFKHAGKQEGYNTDVFTNKAIDFIKTQVEDNKPFYVQLHYHAVHDSLEPKAPEVYFNKFNSDSYTLNNFYAHIYGVDYNVSRITKYLKSVGQFENTIIVFTSDNGAMAAGSYDGFKTGSPLPGNAPFSGHKGTYYQGGIRVPLFIHWPKGIKKHVVAGQLVSTLDILPTCIDAAGGEVPENIDGKSLLPILNNPNNKGIHDILLWAGINSYAWGFLIKKTTKNHNSERNFAPPTWVVIEGDYLLRFVGNMEPGIYTDFLKGREPVFELYNINNDPAEIKNLAEDMPEKVNDLSKKYFSKANKFPPPAKMNKEKWKEIVPRDNLYLNQ